MARVVCGSDELTRSHGSINQLRDQQEIMELRKHLIPHPTPIRQYHPIHIHRSRRPLTVPHSPNIGDKRKKQLAAEREASLVQEQQQASHEAEMIDGH